MSKVRRDNNTICMKQSLGSKFIFGLAAVLWVGLSLVSAAQAEENPLRLDKVAASNFFNP